MMVSRILLKQLQGCIEAAQLAMPSIGHVPIVFPSFFRIPHLSPSGLKSPANTAVNNNMSNSML